MQRLNVERIETCMFRGRRGKVESSPNSVV